MNIQRRQEEYIKFSILIALEDGTSQRFGDLVDRVKFLLNKPEIERGQQDQFYFNVSVVLGQWCRDEKVTWKIARLILICPLDTEK